MRALEDILGRELPEGEGWLRLEDCPFCGQGGRRSPAVIKHDIGFFICHSCKERRSTSYDDSCAARFGMVLKGAAWKAWRTFPGVFTLDEARSYAGERLCVYDGPDNGSCADAGALRRWEKAAGDDEGKLDSYVTQALNCDLIDEARKLLRRMHHEVPEGIGTSALPGEEPDKNDYLTKLLETKSYEDWEYIRNCGLFPRDKYGVLHATKIDGMTQEEVKETMGWTERQLQKRLEAERQELIRNFYLKT